MKIFEIQLRNPQGGIVYKTIVPEIHVQEKIDTLLAMNSLTDLGAICIKEMGDISDRYIQRHLQKATTPSPPKISNG